MCIFCRTLQLRCNYWSLWYESMYTRIHIYIYIYIYINIHTYICLYMYEMRMLQLLKSLIQRVYDTIHNSDVSIHTIRRCDWCMYIYYNDAIDVCIYTMMMQLTYVYVLLCATTVGVSNNTMYVSAQEWTNRTPISHKPLMCSKMCFTKTESVQ